MIITLEHDGQPCLDSSSDKKVPFDIVLPEQSYYPDGPIHPVLRHINTGYVASISTTSDAASEFTTDSYPTDLSTTPRRKRWRLFNSSLLFKKRQPEDPLLSGSTMVEKPTRASRHQSRSRLTPFSRWIVGWVLVSVLLCVIVACGVWIAAKRVYRGFLFQTMNSEWSPEGSTIYTSPPELFGCYNEPSSPALNGSQLLMTVPLGQAGQHIFTIQGGASGQLTLASSPDRNAPEITYDIVIQSNPPSLDKVSFKKPPPGPIIPSITDFLVDTPIETNPSACMRFDITMYIPRSLRQLTVNVSTPVQITFSPQAHIELDNLSIFTTNSHPKCRIDASEALQATSLTIEMYTGLIQGLISIGESTNITNWNGQILLDTIPNAPIDFFNPSTALLRTISHKKAEVRYLRNHAYRRRRIESWHTMGTQDTSTGRFDYGCSGFNGLLRSNSTQYNITNAGSWRAKKADKSEGPWAVVIGNRTGEDKVYIISGSGSIVLPDSPFT